VPRISVLNGLQGGQPRKWDFLSGREREFFSYAQLPELLVFRQSAVRREGDSVLRT
jgi:hypothetical protein